MRDSELGLDLHPPERACHESGSRVAFDWPCIIERCGPLWPLLIECDLALSRAGAARALGFANGAAFDRWLRAQALPPFRLLREWTYVVAVMDGARQEGSLARWSLQRGTYPEIFYRFVARVTGRSWRHARSQDVTWAVASAIQAWRPFLEP